MSWTYYADRKPTKEDSCDSMGFVLARYRDGSHSCITYSLETSAIAWMRLSDLPPLPKRKTWRAPTQVDLDAATEPIPCRVRRYEGSVWYDRLLIGVSKFGSKRFTATNKGSSPNTWEECEIEVEE